MKNNLKKAISAVIALAVAGSLIPASFAAKVTLTDVADTASYATAVNTLVALEVINGYEDNSFKPDNLITRAEASKVIVAALNETASAEKLKGETRFPDVLSKHAWATGFINKGVNLGYIKGDDAGKFNPDANVTTAEVVKMLMVAMGYQKHAEAIAEINGNTGKDWYVPYVDLAKDAGVMDGVNAGETEAITRGEVAQLVYNAIKAPMVKTSGIKYTDSGKPYPGVEIQNGVDSTYFKSILTEKFNAYYVEGYVTDTAKTSDALEVDEVYFGLIKAEDYNHDEIAGVNVKPAAIDNAVVLASPVNVDGTDAADNMGVYATAIIMDLDGDYEFISYVPSGKNKTVELDLKLLDTDDVPADDSYIRFFANEDASRSTKYSLDSTLSYYVNGKKVTPDNYDAFYATYINNKDGKITLVDTYKTNGKYDTIYVDAYATAQVNFVSTSGIVSLKNSTIPATNLKLTDESVEAGELTYNIYYNGEKIKPQDLKENDVLTIAYDVVAGISSSSFYDIYVSRTVVSEALAKRDKENKEVKFGDEFYGFVGLSGYAYENMASAQLGDEYTLYVDYFGDIFLFEVNTTNANYGIVESFAWSDSYDEYRVTIVTADGAEKVYSVESTATLKNSAGSAVTAAALAGDAGLVYVDASAKPATKQDIQGRVITYKVKSSSGKISAINFLAAEASSSKSVDEFDAEYKELGAIEFDDATKIIDAIAYVNDNEDLAAAPISFLKDEIGYTAYAYGEQRTNGGYPFVIVTDGISKFNADSKFAVITADGYSDGTDAAGDYIYTIEAMYGDQTELIVSEDVATEVLDALSKGDVIYFSTNAAGYIKSIKKLFEIDMDEFASDVTLAKAAIKEQAGATLVGANKYGSYITVNNTDGDFSTDFTFDWDYENRDAIRVVFGPIVEKGASDVKFGLVDSSLDTNVREAIRFKFAPEAELDVYTYNYAEGRNNRFSHSTSAGSVYASLTQKTDNVIDWNIAEDINYSEAVIAFAIVLDDEIVDIFQFIGLGN